VFRTSPCKGQYCYITLTTADVGLDYDQNQYDYDDLVSGGAQDKADFGEYGQNGPDREDYVNAYTSLLRSDHPFKHEFQAKAHRTLRNRRIGTR
jgi:hypothetical protein